MNDKYSQKLKSFIQSIEEGAVTKEELIKSIEAVVNYVREIKDNIERDIKDKVEKDLEDNFKKDIEDNIEKGDIDNTKQIEETNSKVEDLNLALDDLRIHVDRCMTDMGDTSSEELVKIKELLDKEISDLKEDIKVKTDFKNLEERITALENEEDIEIPEVDILDIRNRFEVLSEDEKLDKSAIRGLIDDLKRLEKKIDDKISVTGTGGVTNLRIQQAFKYILKTESPTGSINGSNTTYTVKNDIFAVLSFGINGETIAQLPNYTIKGRTITFSSALPSAYSGKDFEIKYI